MESIINTEQLLKKVEDYWNQRPCNIRHSNRAVGSKEYFDEVESKKYRAEPHIPRFAEFEKWKGKSVLEIGCGIGTDTINFARHGACVTVIELSNESLSIARKRAEVYGLTDNVVFYNANAEELSQIISPQCFDLIYSFGVIHHTPRPQKIIDELKLFMGPTSELRIMLYSKFSYKLFSILNETGDWNIGKTERILSEYSEAQTGCPVSYTYTFDEVRKLLEGFDILHIEKDHIFTWDIEHYKRHEFKKDAAWENVTDAYLRQMEKELGWHTLVRAKLKQE